MSVAAPPRAAAPFRERAAGRTFTERVRAALGRPVVATLVLLLVYVALSFANDPRGYLGTDTGGKAAALHAMIDGDLDPDIGYWAERYDPEGTLHPLALTRHIEGRWLSITTLPMLYAAVPLYELGGLHAIVLLPMIGALLTALAARAFARRLGAGGMGAFWLVGLATPVAVYALDFWEHSLGLAAMSWAIVVLLDAIRGHAGWRGAAAAGALFGVAATMRTEALVYAFVAVAITVGMMWHGTRSFGRAARIGACGALGLAVPLALNMVLERAVLGTAFRTARASGAALAPGGGGGSRLDDSLTTTIGLNHFRPTLDWMFGAGITAMVAFAAFLWLTAERDRRRLAWYPFLGACVLYALRFGDGLGFVPGLLTASPLAAVGLVAAWRRPSRLLAWVAVLALPLVWFFQYSGGANPQWGGRYVLLSSVLLATLAVTAIATAPLAGRVALVGLALVVTMCGVAWLSARSHAVADAMRTISETRGAIVSTEFHLLREGGAFYDPQLHWLTAPRPRDVARAAEVVDQAGLDRLTLVGAQRGRPSIGPFERTGARQVEFLPGFDVFLTSYQRA